jgi:hypothetical protein
MILPSKNKKLGSKSIRRAIATILDEYRAGSPTAYPTDAIDKILEVLGIELKLLLTQKYEIQKTYCRERDENGNQVVKSRVVSSGWLDSEGNSYSSDLPRLLTRGLETDENNNATKAVFRVY